MGGGYVPGYGADAIAFMERRSAETHAAFVLPRLAPGTRLLDCGCGPGAITVGLAQRVAPGLVVAVDREPSQTALTAERAAAEGVDNVEVQVADVAALPFPEGSFDAVFAHALLEHLSRPAEALAEMRRVLAPGGMIALAAPDFGGFLLAPPDPEVDRAVEYYRRIRESAGGDPLAGRRLGVHWPRRASRGSSSRPGTRCTTRASRSWSTWPAGSSARPSSTPARAGPWGRRRRR
jgi:SAM-dependent methyltransferase